MADGKTGGSHNINSNKNFFCSDQSIQLWNLLLNKAVVLMWSLFPVLESKFRFSPYVCSLYFKFGLGC